MRYTVEMNRWNGLLTPTYSIIVIICLLAALGVTAFKFLYRENYNFVVEAPCDSATQLCYFRDCTISDSTCPPNGLAVYTRTKIKAEDFKECTDNSCQKECTNGTITCTPITCKSDTDTCLGPGFTGS